MKDPATIAAGLTAAVKLKITYGVTAYDASYAGYGDDQSAEFSSAEEAIAYAQSREPNYCAQAWKQVTMSPINQVLWSYRDAAVAAAAQREGGGDV